MLTNCFDNRNINLIVVKVGTSTLTYPSGYINLRRVEELVMTLSDLKNSGKQIVLVSSGAVGCGMGKLGLRAGEISIEEKQAAAAVGQCELMDMYSRRFGKYGHTVGQILLTRDVTDDLVRREHAENTLRVLISKGCIPVINENDSISTEELKYGGNDTLSATVALLCHADLLINLSDIDGFYTADPKLDPNATIQHYITEIDEAKMGMASGAGTARGTGGMSAKLIAAKMCMDNGVSMVIANGANPAILYDIVEGNISGTLFDAKE